MDLTTIRQAQQGIEEAVNEIYESFKNEELDLVSEELKNEVE